MDLAIGTRVYNHGDMANLAHFGKITGERDQHVEITPEEGERRPYWVSRHMFSEVFFGHSGTRFVTGAAYDRWRDQMSATLAERVKRSNPKLARR